MCGSFVSAIHEQIYIVLAAQASTRDPRWRNQRVCGAYTYVRPSEKSPIPDVKCVIPLTKSIADPVKAKHFSRMRDYEQCPCRTLLDTYSLLDSLTKSSHRVF